MVDHGGCIVDYTEIAGLLDYDVDGRRLLVSDA